MKNINVYIGAFLGFVTVVVSYSTYLIIRNNTQTPFVSRVVEYSNTSFPGENLSIKYDITRNWTDCYVLVEFYLVPAVYVAQSKPVEILLQNSVRYIEKDNKSSLVQNIIPVPVNVLPGKYLLNLRTGWTCNVMHRLLSPTIVVNKPLLIEIKEVR